MDWPEIRKLEIPSSEFCPISEDWGKLGVPNLAETPLIKCCWVLRNTRVAAFTVSKLLRKNQQRREGGDYPSSPSTHLVRVKYSKKKKWSFPLGISSVNVTDRIHSFLQIWSHLLQKSLMENALFSHRRGAHLKNSI